MLGCKEIAGVEIAVAQELKRIPVEAIGAGFGDYVDHSSGMVPILCRKVAGLNTELLNGIREGEGEINV